MQQITTRETEKYNQPGQTGTQQQSTGTNTGGEAQGDVFSSIEEIEGSDFDDTLTGDGADNYFEGGLGNDSLVGAAGNDTIFGDSGDDYVDGGAGNDVLNGGLGTNTLDYSASASFVVAISRFTLGSVASSRNSTCPNEIWDKGRSK